MTAFIYISGHIYPDGITDFPEKEDLIIGADGGWKNAKALGVTPNIILGDFDSSDPPENSECEIIQYPKEKNETDGQIAVRYAVKKGAKHIVIVGTLEGRLDHTLSLLSIFEELHEKHISCMMTNGKNKVWYVKNDSFLVGRDSFPYLSILAISEKLKGVTLEGCKYPLKNATLYRNNQYAISNELTGNCAFIEIKKGSALIIKSRD